MRACNVTSPTITRWVSEAGGRAAGVEPALDPALEPEAVAGVAVGGKVSVIGVLLSG
ncbi:hypothetical protein GCM10009078_45120 [Cupriavidus gilardii]